MRMILSALICAAMLGPSVACDRHHMNGPHFNLSFPFWHHGSHLVWTRDGKRFDMRFQGTQTFTDDDHDLISLSDGGSLRITVYEGWHGTTFEAKGRANGIIERTFQGKAGDSAEAKAWLASVLPEFIRQRGVDAEARALRVLAKQGFDGPQGLLAEIARINSDEVQRRYYESWFDGGKPEPSMVVRALDQAGRGIESDYELASLLIHLAEKKPPQDSIQVACAETARHIDSDYELRRTLKALLGMGKPSADLARAIAISAEGIDSDHERGGLVQDLAKATDSKSFPMERVLGLVGGIDSDYERHHALRSILARGPLDTDSLALVIQCAGKMDSDFEKASCLLDVLEHQKVVGVAKESFTHATEKIDSEYERNRVFTALAKRG